MTPLNHVQQEAGEPFFVAGGTLEHNAPCYVERRADSELYACLHRGEFCYVLTSRQMGKSSLMVRAAARLRQEGAAVVVLDLTAIGRDVTLEQWCNSLLEHLGVRLEIEEQLEPFQQAHQRFGPVPCLMTALREVVLTCFVGRVVIFIDEIDTVRSLPFSTDEFFAAIRACYNRRSEDPEMKRLTFCLLGVASPSDLIRDTRITPFNIGRRIELTDFTAEEAAPLAAGLGVGCWVLGVQDRLPQHPTPNTQHLLRRILYWTGGHPYLTQRLCQAVAEASADPNPKSKRPEGIQNPKSTVDRLCRTLFLTKSAAQTDDNLLFVRERLLRSEADAAALLDMYARVWAGKRVVADDTNRWVEILRLSGITRLWEGKSVGSRSFRLFPFSFCLPEGRLRVRNRIYERVFDRAWVLAHMPDAEVRRQRAAYRTGLLRAGAIAALVVAVLVGLLAAVAQKSQESLHHLVRLNLYTGERALQDGDPLGALPWFAEALRLDQGDRAREEMDRYRLASVLRQSPSIVQLWSPQQGSIPDRCWSQDLRRVVVTTASGQAQVWDTVTGHAPSPPLASTGAVYSADFSPNGRWLALGGYEGSVSTWEIRTGRRVGRGIRHSMRIVCVHFSPDSRRIVTGSDDQTARVWDVATGVPLTPPLRHTGGVKWAAFSPDGRRVVTGSIDGTARVWNATTGQPITPPMPHDGWVTRAEFSPDGQRVLTSVALTPPGHTAAARVWNARTGQPITPSMWHGRFIHWSAFSADGRRVVTTSNDHSARVWDARTGRPVTPPLPCGGDVLNAAFSPDGARVVTVGYDSTARVWDATTGEPVTPPLPHNSPTLSAAFSGDGRFLTTLDEGHTVRRWDLATSEATAASFQETGRGATASFSPDGHLIIASGYDSGTACVWDLATGQPLFRPIQHAEGVPYAGFSPDGQRLATACWDGTAQVWEAATGWPITPPLRHPRALYRAAFSPDGRRLVTMCKDQTARIWSTITGRLLTGPLKDEGIDSFYALCQFSPDGRRLVTGSHEGARVWDAASGRLLMRFPRQAFAAFSPDGKRLLTWGETQPFGDPTARVWDAATFRPAGPVLTHTAEVMTAAFSPDGRRVVTGSSGIARVWDPITGAPITPPMQHYGGEGSVAAFSPDGRRVLTNSPADPTVRLWDAATGEPISAPLRQHDGVVTAAFSPDGRRVVTGCNDGSVQVWDVSAADRSVPDLLRMAAVQASRRIDATGGSAGMTAAELLQAWQTLRARYPHGPIAPPADELAWHRHEAAEDERKREWSPALSHLNRLIESRPGDPLLRARRANVRASLGQWGPALADLSQPIALGVVDPEVWYQQALLRLAVGDLHGYRRSCADMLQRFGGIGKAEISNRVAQACALGPDAVAVPARPIALMRAAIAYDTRNAPYHTTLGAALYRAGRLEEAVQRLNEAEAMTSPGSDAPYALWLAMCHQRLGHPAEARRWLDRGLRSPAPVPGADPTTAPSAGASLPWTERLEQQLRRREAVALIRPEITLRR